MMAVYNDEDVIQEVLEHNISQGMEFVLLDNGSTDKTYEICKEFLNQGVLNLIQYQSKNWDYPTILRMIYDMALVYSPDWVVYCDSDEVFESGINDLTLSGVISLAKNEGYNLIQFDRFDFHMTDDDMQESTSIKKRLPYYVHNIDYLYRAWEYFPGIRVRDGGGHIPIFPEGHRYKIYPSKCVIRHYPYRSKEQAERRLSSRISRTQDTPETKAGIKNIHYQKIRERNFPPIFNHKVLTKYNEDNNWIIRQTDRDPKKLHNKKREEVFSKKGELLVNYPTVAELRIRILKQRKTIEDLNNKLNENQKK